MIYQWVNGASTSPIISCAIIADVGHIDISEQVQSGGIDHKPEFADNQYKLIN